MKQEELIKGLKVLGIAYGKDFNQEECATYYEFLQEYNYETFKTAVKNIIRKSKFMPKINELIEECENYKERTKFEVLDFMKEKGYFKSIIEYEKATSFMERNIVPEWLQRDINEYYKMMKQDKLGYQEQILIG